MNTDGRALHDKLRQLWLLVLNVLIDALAKPTVRASMLAVARQFLKDNGVDASSMVDMRSNMDALKKSIAGLDMSLIPGYRTDDDGSKPT